MQQRIKDSCMKSEVNSQVEDNGIKSKITLHGFTYEYSLDNTLFEIEAIHNTSKRAWYNKLDSLMWTTGFILSSKQVNSAFESQSLIFPQDLPATQSNLQIQLKFDLLGEDYLVDLNLIEKEITEIDRLKMIISDLSKEVRNLRTKLDIGFNELITATGKGDFYYAQHDNEYCLKLKPGAITSYHIADDSILSQHIMSNSISGGHIINQAIHSEHIAEDAISQNHIINNAICSEHIRSGCISNTHIGYKTITSNELSYNLTDHFASK